MTNSSSISKKDVNINFYELLEIDKTASELQIKSSYRKLALKYHPDRNQGCTEAAEKFKQISTAYTILSDPNKRRQYDLAGETGAEFEFESVDVEQMGGFGRMVGALFSKMGLPIPTQISQTTLHAARDISDSGLLLNDTDRMENKNNTNDIKLKYYLKDIHFGQEIASKVDKQDAHFYRLHITQEEANNGIIISCRSASKSKFKLVLFDSSGGVRFVQESSKNDKYTVADMHLSHTDFMTINKAWINLHDTETQILPNTFQKLATLEPSNTCTLSSGIHLFCVYGDNWFSAIKYTVKCMISKINTDQVKNIQIIEKELVNLKNELDIFQSEYIDIKKKYEAAEEKVKNSDEKIINLLSKRENAYEEYLKLCNEQYIIKNDNINTNSNTNSNTKMTSNSNIDETTSSFRNMFSGISNRFRSNKEDTDTRTK